MRLPLPSLFFFPPAPHQKALNQFHALQMLFTLLGVKHLLFAPLGFLSFFSLADSLWLFFFSPLPSKKRRLYKDACCRPAPGVRTVDCPRRASKKKKKTEKKQGWRSLASCLRWRGTWRRSIVHLTNSRNCAAICFLYSAITGRACYDALSGFFFWCLSRGNLLLRSEETLPSITIHAIWKSFVKHPYSSGTSNKPNEKSTPARSRASHFHFSLLVTATVPGAVGFKVILKGL